MILPTKRLAPDRSLLHLGAEILSLLQEPKSVTRLWNELQQRREGNTADAVVTYDWFILGLDFLFTLDTVRMDQGILKKNRTYAVERSGCERVE